MKGWHRIETRWFRFLHQEGWAGTEISLLLKWRRR